MSSAASVLTAPEPLSLVGLAPLERNLEIQVLDTHPRIVGVRWEPDLVALNGSFVSALAAFCTTANAPSNLGGVRVEVYNVPPELLPAFDRGLDPFLSRFQDRPGGASSRVVHYFGRRISVVVYPPSPRHSATPVLCVQGSDDLSACVAQLVTATTPASVDDLKALLSDAYRAREETF